MVKCMRSIDELRKHSLGKAKSGWAAFMCYNNRTLVRRQLNLGSIRVEPLFDSTRT